MSVRIGIDLGTTNSAVAMVYDDGPSLVPRGSLNPVFEPSVARLRLEGGCSDWVVGTQADQGQPRVIRSIKRLMGRTYSSAIAQGADRHFADAWLRLERRHQDDLRLQLLDDHGSQVAAVWPQEISAHILRHLRSRAEHELRTEVEAAVVTVPAYFEDPHRAATLEAARLASLQVLEPLLDEPTAAALAFSRIVGLSAGEPLLVVDWGGGTLDVTVIVGDGSTFTELTIDGDLYLGGDDLDLLLAEHIIERKKLDAGVLQDPASRFALLKAVRNAKHMLSRDRSASVLCMVNDPVRGAVKLAEPIGREDFERLIGPLLERVGTVIGRCLDHRDVPVDEIRNVLLVGGSMLIPSARNRLQTLLPRATMRDEVNPMHAVALGAAVYAERQQDTVARICPYGYAVEAGGRLEDLIGCGQEVPTPEHLPYRLQPALATTYDNQTVCRVTLHRFSAHDDGLRGVSKQGSLRVFGRHLPAKPRGTPVACEFWLDQNKELKARIQMEGGGSIKMERISLAEVGPSAVFTHLKDKSLEAEALIEGNAEREAPLVARLRDAWQAADKAVDLESIQEGERCLATIDDLLEQARSAAREKTDALTEDEARERVFGWTLFYEQDLLPKYGYLLDEKTLTAVLETISRIRVMFRTGASADELGLQLRQLQIAVQGCACGPLMVAYRESRVVGVPAGLTSEIEDLCAKVASEMRRGSPVRTTPALKEMQQKAEEAGRHWREWQESRGMKSVGPDLAKGNRNDPSE